MNRRTRVVVAAVPGAAVAGTALQEDASAIALPRAGAALVARVVALLAEAGAADVRVLGGTVREVVHGLLDGAPGTAPEHPRTNLRDRR